MLLGTKKHPAGNKTRYSIFYGNWLEDGTAISNATVVLSPTNAPQPTDVTISAVTWTPDTVYFYLAGGSVGENFTVNIQATNTRTEIKNDTAGFAVVAA